MEIIKNHEHFLRPRWRAIRHRCYNFQAEKFPRYGGRGITMCPEWFNSFDAFLADMGLPPTDKHSIERRDNDGPYSPENCEWATPQEQQRNTHRGSKMITHDGRTMHLREWSKETGIAPSTLHKRFDKGLRGEALFATPMKHSEIAAMGGSAGKGKPKHRH